jgi:tetratricopeptide (TPR) repeat protein
MRHRQSICSLLVCLGFLLPATFSEGQASSNIGPRTPDDVLRSNEKAKKIFEQGHQADQYGDYQTAIRDYSEAIRLNPEYVDAYFCRGTLYRVTLHQYRKAISDYDEAIRIRPTLAYAYEYRGFAYKALGNNSQASEDFEQANKLFRDPRLWHTDK